MINLIPGTEKERARHNHQRRFLAALLSLTATGFVLGAVFLAPSYFLINEKNDVISDGLNMYRIISGTKTGGGSEIAAEDIHEKLDILALGGTNNPPSRLASLIINSRQEGVSVAGISYEKAGEGKANLEVRGTSQDKAGLLGFVKTLKSTPIFTRADVPASVFAKDKNLNFSIEIEANI